MSFLIYSKLSFVFYFHCFIAILRIQSKSKWLTTLNPLCFAIMNSLKDKEEDMQFKKFGCSEKNLTNLMSADI